jgi:hypothetical protein
MKPAILKGFPVGLAAVLLWSSLAFALDSWKVSDFSGDVSIGRGGERIPAKIGLDVTAGDTISIGDGVWVELVSTGTCRVWELKDAMQYIFGKDDIMTGADKSKVSPDHRLSVCFDPGGFSTGRAQRIGGIIERGGSPEQELAEIGLKSNAALINLIILYALEGNDIEKARPYYEALKQRTPRSQFVASVSSIFELKRPQGNQERMK